MTWEAGWVWLAGFYSHKCFEEYAVTLIKGVRIVMRQLTELSSSLAKSYMLRGIITPLQPPFLFVKGRK